MRAFVALLLLLSAFPAAAADGDRVSKDYFKGYWYDSRDLALSPLLWRPTEYRALFGVVAVTGLAYSMDDRLLRGVARRRGDSRDQLAKQSEHLGDGAYLLPGLVGTYLIGHYTDDARTRRFALYGAQSFVVSGVLVHVVKQLAGRHRPYTGDGKDAWDGPGIRSDADKLSFPSGHTVSAFAVATSAANIYRDEAWVPPTAYTLATLVGLSRVYAGKHWPSDVVFGAALGYFTAKSIVGYHDGDGKRARLQPEIGERYAGVALKVPF